MNLFISLLLRAWTDVVREFGIRDLRNFPRDNRGKEIEIVHECGNRLVFSRERHFGLRMTRLVGSDENFHCTEKISAVYSLTPKCDFPTANQRISALNLHFVHRMRYYVYPGKINFVSIRSESKNYFKNIFPRCFYLKLMESDYLGS